jgi:N4-gp56 family major capsid protein
MPGNNTAGQFAADRINYIEKKVLPLARRQLCAYQFATRAELPKGMGTTYTATRYNRLTVPFAPLSEGVPPVGETMTISQVSGICQQWGDKVTVTDVAEMTIFHPTFQQAIRLTALQIAESDERNTYLTLSGGAQVNFVNQRGARSAIVAGDVLDPHTVNRTVASLMTIGAPRFGGDDETDARVDVKTGGSNASANPRTHAHYVSIIHPLVASDFRENGTVQTAWSYSDINRLYNFEIGEWSSLIFCMSNMVPFWNGLAAVTGAAGTTGGTLTAGTTYFTQVTGSDGQRQYESQIYQVDGGTAPGGANTALTLTVPNVAGFTYSVYIGTNASALANLATSPQGPTSGPYTGVATQINPGATVTLTGIGPQQVPPAAPATGITVFATYVFGRDYYSMIDLDNVRMTYLDTADKSDPLNQLRIVGWKKFYGVMFTNQQFGARIESASNFTPTFG